MENPPAKTAGELIAILQKYPSDTPVAAETFGHVCVMEICKSDYAPFHLELCGNE